MTSSSWTPRACRCAWQASSETAVPSPNNLQLILALPEGRQNIICCSGTLNASNLSVIDQSTLSIASSFNYAAAFFSCAGLSGGMSTSRSLKNCALLTAAARQAERSYLQYAAGNIMHRELCASDDVASRVQLLHTGCVETESGQEWPLYGQQRILGVLRLPRMALSDAQRQLLCSMLESTAMAIDRLSAAQAQQRYREESFQERTRSNLLRAISHDLRTPLSGIMGTSEMIRDLSAQDDPRRRLAQDIWRDADWLHALVENILSLTRLQDGRLQIEKQPEAVEEIVGSALAQMERRAPDREIDAELPEELLMVPMDAKLIVQMLVNLLDNAMRHTPAGNEIKVCVERRDGKAVFSVLDRGEGIREEDMPHLFERFYTTRGKSADAARGVGLGLSICDAIARAHGGSITARNREGGGAVFAFELPMEGENP